VRQKLIALYAVGVLILLAGLFGGGTRNALIALLGGMAAVIAAGTVDSIWRRRRALAYTTSDWLKGRRNPSPPRAQVWLLLIAAVLWVAAFALQGTPHNGIRHYIQALLVLIYVAAVGNQIFRRAPQSTPAAHG
jgi:hypothetical protein